MGSEMCIRDRSYVSCICNSLGSHETYHCLYGKTQRCLCSDFRFVKQINIRKYGAKFEREENVGENQNSDCSIFAQYLLMHLSVEAIRSKLKHFHSYMISRQGLFICIT